MRIITSTQIIKTVAQLCIESNYIINPDIHRALCDAHNICELETLAATALETLLQNAEIAKREQLPLCQDTGMTVVFVTIGRDVRIDGNIDQAINEGVRQGYRKGYFRKSIVKDPINRINTNDNTPAVIHYEFGEGDELHLTVVPKGFGSENMGGLRMLNPSDGIKGIEGYVIERVKAAGANPCPPIIVGVGVGGTMEKAALLAKKALLRKVGGSHPDPFWAEVETRLKLKINELGIGAAGFGGKTTALGVHVLTYPTHIAGLPVAVNIGCHSTRHRSAIL